MSKQKSTRKTVNFNPLMRSSSGSEYQLDEIDKLHNRLRKENNYLSNSNGEPQTEFGLSSSNFRDPNNPQESKRALWWTYKEKELAQLRNVLLHKRASTINKIMEKGNEIKKLKEILIQMKKAKIEDPKFKKDIDNLETEIRDMERVISIVNKNIEDIEKQMSNIANEDDIIIEERHINHEDDEIWIESVIKKLPHLDEQYIKMRYNELTGFKGGVKKKSKKRMVQRKSKTRKVIKTKLKKANKKFR